MNKSIQEIVKGSALGILGRVLGGFINFFSLPILLALYGKSNYGLVGVALSTNAFLQIMNMGVPTGAVKNFSEWVESKDFISLTKGIQTNLLFFVTIAAINSLVLIYLGYNASQFFTVQDPATLSILLYIVAATSFLNWYFTNFQHLLLANEKMGLVSWANTLNSFLNFFAVIVAYFLKLSITEYFFIYSIGPLLVLLINIRSCIRLDFFKKEYLIPKFHKVEFNKIMGYSMGLFGVVIFQYAANQLQPIILSTFGKRGDIAVANYRILQNVTMLVSMMGSIFLQNFVPYITKLNHRGDDKKKEDFVFMSTKWLSVFIFFVCFFIFFNSAAILNAYVKEDGTGLSIWLSIWILGLLFLNNQGISSLLLSMGKFKILVITLFIGSACSVVIAISLVDQLGVGVTAIGFLVFKIIEAVFFYGYFLPKMAKISSIKLFKSTMFRPLLASIVSVVLAKYLISLVQIDQIIGLVINVMFSSVIYLVAIYYFIISKDERNVFLSFRKK